MFTFSGFAMFHQGRCWAHRAASAAWSKACDRMVQWRGAAACAVGEAFHYTTSFDASWKFHRFVSARMLGAFWIYFLENLKKRRFRDITVFPRMPKAAVSSPSHCIKAAAGGPCRPALRPWCTGGWPQGRRQIQTAATGMKSVKTRQFSSQWNFEFQRVTVCAGYLGRLVTRISDNLELQLRDLHIRFQVHIWTYVLCVVFFKSTTNIIADVTVERTTPLLLVVHLSRVVCTWLPWKYRAQVLVNTKGWCFDVGNVGKYDTMRWYTMDYDSRLNDFNPCGSTWQPSNRFQPTAGSDWQPSFIERSDRKQLFKLLRLRTCRFQSCSVF